MKNFFLFLFVFASLLSCLSFSPAQAALGLEGGYEIVDPAKTGLGNASAEKVLTNILLWLLGSLAVLATLGFVGSGILYITSGGGEQKEIAKKWIRYTLIGLFVALASFGIVYTIDLIIGYRSGNDFSL